jgi:hypothetical protein
MSLLAGYILKETLCCVMSTFCPFLFPKRNVKMWYHFLNLCFHISCSSSSIFMPLVLYILIFFKSKLFWPLQKQCKKYVSLCVCIVYEIYCFSFYNWQMALLENLILTHKVLTMKAPNIQQHLIFMLPTEKWQRHHCVCYMNVKLGLLPQREEHRLRVSEDRCWGEFLNLRARKWQEAREGYLNEELHNLYDYWSDEDKEEIGRACSMYGRDEMFTKFWSEIMKWRDHSEDWDIDGKMILECILQK